MAEVENELRDALDLFERRFPDDTERAAAQLALFRRLGIIIAKRALDTTGAAKARRADEGWWKVLHALDSLPACELCGGTGLIIARVDSLTRGSLPGLAVPCVACGGRR